MMLNSLLVAAGGFLGAIARYSSTQWIGQRTSSIFPFATLFVNLLGSFLLGMIAGGKWSSTASLLFGVGFMGAFTTFSTFKMDSLQLGIKREWIVLVQYMAVTYTFGILLAFLGFAITSHLKG